MPNMCAAKGPRILNLMLEGSIGNNISEKL